MINRTDSFRGHGEKGNIPLSVIDFRSQGRWGEGKVIIPFFNMRGGSGDVIEPMDDRRRHREYTLPAEHFDTKAIKKAVDNFNKNVYNPLTFNCATAVAYVMKKANVPNVPRHLVWTPSAMARWCDQLVAENKVRKTKR